MENGKHMFLAFSHFDLQKKYFIYANKEMPAPVGFSSSARMPGVHDAIKQLQSNTGHKYLVGGAVRTLHHLNQEKEEHMNQEKDQEGQSGFGDFFVTHPNAKAWQHAHEQMNDDGDFPRGIFPDILCIFASILVIVLFFGVVSISSE